MDIMYDYLEYVHELNTYGCTVFQKRYLPFFLERCKECGRKVSTRETEDGYVWVSKEDKQ